MVLVKARAAQRTLLMPLDAVQEVVLMAQLQQVGHGHDGLDGLLDLRGTAVPVYRFGPSDVDALDELVLVASQSDGPVGIVVSDMEVCVVDDEEVTTRTMNDGPTRFVRLDGSLHRLVDPRFEKVLDV